MMHLYWIDPSEWVGKITARVDSHTCRGSSSSSEDVYMLVQISFPSDSSMFVFDPHYLMASVKNKKKRLMI